MNNLSSYSPNLIKRILASGAVGTLLEGYELLSITIMTATLSQVFFPPSTKPYAHVINFIYVLLISRLFRPIGTIIVAVFVDQFGRKKTMATSLTLMGISSTLIGILPAYEYIGVWSTFLFITLRLFMSILSG